MPEDLPDHRRILVLRAHHEHSSDGIVNRNHAPQAAQKLIAERAEGYLSFPHEKRVAVVGITPNQGLRYE